VSYYQKYRPQRIEELDLVDVRENLLSALRGGRLPHAYLFVGPRGSGKTSAARILAQVVNCEANQPPKLKEPCGKCKTCKGIRLGNEVDVLEMDAASHRGIDDIRSLKERIKLSPVSLRKKIYIIDEVHMLTKEAFNALLKVLEEPPKHVMFFLCTTEEHKVPETIISRCAKVTFTKATEEEVESSLMKVVKGEKLKIEKGAIKLLAKSVDGSFREGHKLLQQLGSEKKITEEEVEKILGLAGGDNVVDLLKVSLEGRPKEIGKKLAELEKKGVNAGNLLESLLKALQEMIRETVEKDDEMGLKIRLAELLIESSEKLKVSPLPFLPIELALLEVALARTGGKVKKVEVKTKEDEGEGSEAKQESADDPVGVETKEANENDLSLSRIEKEWEKLLDRLSEKNRSVAGLLRASRPKVANGNNLTVEVFYEFHKSQLEQDSKRVLVEQVAKELWGPTVLRCVLGERRKQKTAGEDRVVEVAREDDYIKAAEDVFGS